MNEFHKSRSDSSIEKAKAKARRSKFMRRFITPLAIATAVGGGVAYIATRGGEEYHPRSTTVQAGDTLSEIANDELQRQGDEDPTTQEIDAYDQKIAEENPDEVTGSGASASAAVGEVLTLPKK